MAWTVIALLKVATEHLKSRGDEEARLDAELLLGSVLKKDRLGVYLAHDMPLGDEAVAQYRELIRRRARGEPTAYLLGRREFFSRTFRCDPRCLIPRPETEQLVSAVLSYAKAIGESGQELTIGDLGTGSGCIAISLALELPSARIVATDLSQDALEIAAENALLHGVQDRVKMIQGDFLDALDGMGPFDVLVSNPPYIPERERAALPRDVVMFEPETALFSGEDPFFFHRKLGRARGAHLKKGGVIVMEVGAPTEEEAREAFREFSSDHEIRFQKDLAGHLRVVEMRRI